jgi:hypothetical protein
MRIIRELLTRTKGERGTGTLEMAIIGGMVVLIFVVVALLVRVDQTGNAVESAADAAAREASLARDTSQAQNAAAQMANISLAQAGVNCVHLSVSIDAAGINAPLGTTGVVSATITCTVAIGNSGLIGQAPTRDITATAISPVDAYRER